MERDTGAKPTSGNQPPHGSEAEPGLPEAFASIADEYGILPEMAEGIKFLNDLEIGRRLEMRLKPIKVDDDFERKTQVELPEVDVTIGIAIPVNYKDLSSKDPSSQDGALVILGDGDIRLLALSGTSAETVREFHEMFDPAPDAIQFRGLNSLQKIKRNLFHNKGTDVILRSDDPAQEAIIHNNLSSWFGEAIRMRDVRITSQRAGRDHFEKTIENLRGTIYPGIQSAE